MCKQNASIHSYKKACFKFFYEKKLVFSDEGKLITLMKSAADQGQENSHKATLGQPYFIVIKNIQGAYVLQLLIICLQLTS